MHVCVCVCLGVCASYMAWCGYVCNVCLDMSVRCVCVCLCSLCVCAVCVLVCMSLR